MLPEVFTGGRYDTAPGKSHEATMISIPLDKMSLAEKLEAMEALWEDLSRTPADVPVLGGAAAPARKLNPAKKGAARRTARVRRQRAPRSSSGGGS